MSAHAPTIQKTALFSLRKRWALFAGFCLSLLAAGYTCLQAAWEPGYAGRWLALAAALTAYLLVVFWRGLRQNHRPGEAVLLPDLGAGNILTLLRGALLAALAGFLLAPRPAGGLAWLPALIYTLAIAADYLDGYAARRANRVTRLGEILDMSFDGTGVLVAALLAVAYGQVPAWYLLVAAARPLFLAGEWLRRRQGMPVYPLPPSVRRRAFAGVQMGFVSVMLWPPFTPPGTHIAAALFALPFLAGFVVDWLVASGALRPAAQPADKRAGAFRRWLPLALRLAVVALNLAILWPRFRDFPAPLAFLTGPLLLGLLEVTVSILILAGIAGRMAAIAGLLLLGAEQVFASLVPGQIILAGVYTALLYLGTGQPALWQPEERWIYQRAGETRRPAKN